MEPLLTWPHVPIILFLAGALLCVLQGERVSGRLGIALISTIFLVVGLVLLIMRPQLPVDVVFSDWVASLTLLGSLIYRVDAVSFVCALALTLVLAAAFWALSSTDRPPNTWRLTPALLCVCAGAFSALFSGNLLTLMFSWALLTSALFAFVAFGEAARRTAVYLLVTWGLGIILAAWATWSIGRGDGGRLATIPYSPTAVRAMFLLAWISLAALPMHLWLIAIWERRSQSDATNGRIMDVIPAVLHSVSPLLGLYILMRLTTSQAVLPEQAVWIGAGAVSLLMASESAWSQRDRRQTISYITIAQGGAGMLSVALSGPMAGNSVLHWLLVLPCAVLVLFAVPNRAQSGDPVWQDWLSMAVTGLAGACLLGLPPTAGFVAWSNVYEAIWSTDLVEPLFLLAPVFIAASLIAAAFFRAWLAPMERTPLRRGWVPGAVGLVLLAPALSAGLLPVDVLRNLTGGHGVDLGLWAYRPVEPRTWATILLSACLGYAWSTWRPAATATRQPVWLFFVGLWDMAWLYRGIEKVVAWGDNMLRLLVDVLCGEHWLLWAVLSVLLFVWFYLWG